MDGDGIQHRVSVLREVADQSRRQSGRVVQVALVPPALPNLYFIGLVQPWGAIMPLAELQSQWVADLLQGQAGLPGPDEMRADICRQIASKWPGAIRARRGT